MLGRSHVVRSSGRARAAARLITLFVGAIGPWRPFQARAEGFTISPISISFATHTEVHTLTLSNTTERATRFSVQVMKWNQNELGEMTFAPASEVVFFPAMVVLGPRESRSVRVAIKVAPTDREQTFRLFFQELPPVAHTEASGAPGIEVLRRVSIPVFITPAAPDTHPVLSPLSLAASSLRFSLSNPGNVHLRPMHVAVLLSRGDEVILRRELTSWYVLAGDARDYLVPLPVDVCLSATAIAVEVDSYRGTARAALPVEQCAPAPQGGD